MRRILAKVLRRAAHRVDPNYVVVYPRIDVDDLVRRIERAGR